MVSMMASMLHSRVFRADFKKPLYSAVIEIFSIRSLLYIHVSFQVD